MRFKFVFVALAVLSLSLQSAYSLPFNDDLHHSQKYRPGAMARMKPAGSVPIGSLKHRIENKAEAMALVNPQKGDKLSIFNGKRLYSVNCAPCHGANADGNSGPVAQPGKFTPPPNLLADLYKQKPDGYFYGTIEFGGLVVMPPYGWKLSATEKWDIVNYIRKLQGVN